MDATREKCAAASRRVLKLGIVSFRGKMPDPRSTCQKAPAGPRPPSKGDGRSLLPAQAPSRARRIGATTIRTIVANTARSLIRPPRDQGRSGRRCRPTDHREGDRTQPTLFGPHRSPLAAVRAAATGLVLKALTLAIEIISTLPENSQLSSDVEDTRGILQVMLPKDEDLVTYQKSVQWMVHGTLPE